MINLAIYNNVLTAINIRGVYNLLSIHASSDGFRSRGPWEVVILWPIHKNVTVHNSISPVVVSWNSWIRLWYHVATVQQCIMHGVVEDYTNDIG